MVYKSFTYKMSVSVFVSWGSCQPLAVPGRLVIGEGILTKMCRKKPKLRQFFLFSDILIYGNIVVQGKKVNFINYLVGLPFKNVHTHTRHFSGHFPDELS